MSEDYQIDNIDRQIMEHLLQNARMPYTEIAEKILVSPGTIHVRMKKLEKLSVVLGTELVINPAKLGYDLTAFIGIYLKESIQYKDVVPQLEAIPEIIEAYYTTGGYSIFAKIICTNTNHLRTVLNEKIQAVSGIQRTDTMISLEQSIRKKIPVQLANY
ncbi:MAG: Lrp/AsnC ligand binding domain-containing protein [Cryomorphaceae bacterium]|nr:Lrp/AsnC ligand binding domain-containing protein [Flavobacteriales bacterium]